VAGTDTQPRPIKMPAWSRHRDWRPGRSVPPTLSASVRHV